MGVGRTDSAHGNAMFRSLVQSIAAQDTDGPGIASMTNEAS